MSTCSVSSQQNPCNEHVPFLFTLHADLMLRAFVAPSFGLYAVCNLKRLLKSSIGETEIDSSAQNSILFIYYYLSIYLFILILLPLFFPLVLRLLSCCCSYYYSFFVFFCSVRIKDLYSTNRSRLKNIFGGLCSYFSYFGETPCFVISNR